MWSDFDFGPVPMTSSILQRSIQRNADWQGLFSIFDFFHSLLAIQEKLLTPIWLWRKDVIRHQRNWPWLLSPNAWHWCHFLFRMLIECARRGNHCVSRHTPISCQQCRDHSAVLTVSYPNRDVKDVKESYFRRESTLASLRTTGPKDISNILIPLHANHD